MCLGLGERSGWVSRCEVGSGHLQVKRSHKLVLIITIKCPPNVGIIDVGSLVIFELLVSLQ